MYQNYRADFKILVVQKTYVDYRVDIQKLYLLHSWLAGGGVILHSVEIQYIV